MGDLNLNVIIMGGVAYVLKDIWILSIKSCIQYLMRGEFNHDGDWKTADAFDHLNPNLGTFQRRYITKYTLTGVHWGFFNDSGYVKRFSWWFEWAADRPNRFRVAEPMKFENEEEYLSNLMRSKQ